MSYFKFLSEAEDSVVRELLDQYSTAVEKLKLCETKPGWLQKGRLANDEWRKACIEVDLAWERYSKRAKK